VSRLSEYKRLLASRKIAAELVQWGTDLNVLRSAASYMKANPDADLFVWLDRLVQLGDYFASSEQTGRYRQQVRSACVRARDTFDVSDGADWVWILAWASRFMLYYQEFPKAARAISEVPPFQPEPVQPFRRQTPHQLETLPEPLPEPTQMAEDLMAQLQKAWQEKEAK
jgi:hypothetical protein